MHSEKHFSVAETITLYKEKETHLLIENLLVLSFPGNSFTPLDLKSPDRFTAQQKKTNTIRHIFIRCRSALKSLLQNYVSDSLSNKVIYLQD